MLGRLGASCRAATRRALLTKSARSAGAVAAAAAAAYLATDCQPAQPTPSSSARVFPLTSSFVADAAAMVAPSLVNISVQVSGHHFLPLITQASAWVGAAQQRQKQPHHCDTSTSTLHQQRRSVDTATTSERPASASRPRPLEASASRCARHGAVGDTAPASPPRLAPALAPLPAPDQTPRPTPVDRRLIVDESGLVLTLPHWSKALATPLPARQRRRLGADSSSTSRVWC